MELTELETLAARKALQLPHLRRLFATELKLVIETKLALVFDPAKPLDFTQQEAYSKGKLDTILWLLQMSDPIEDESAPSIPQPKS